MKNENWIQQELNGLAAQNLDRHLVTYTSDGGSVRQGERSFTNFSSNNYLNLSINKKIISASEKLLLQSGSGAGASRLVTGTLNCHTELEKRLAQFKGYPAALIFGSGFLTNLGAISVCAGKNDHVFADRLAHASIVDAIIYSRAQLHRFNHNDPDHLETLLKNCPQSGRRLVVTESVFSMDGDLAPLTEIVSLAEKYNALVMVDEAHSTGIFGPCGRGIVNRLKLESRVNIAMGTFSKAFGSYGGFIACSDSMRSLMINRARSFIYTTALPPAIIGSISGALDVLEEDPAMGSELLENASLFRSRLNEAGLDTGNSASQIIPVIVGDSGKTIALSKRLKENGILAIAIRPPTVPRGTARIRFSVTLGHSKQILEKSADIITDCAAQEGII